MPGPLFAHVLLSPPAGTDAANITSQTLQAAAPDAQTVAGLRARFEAAGFQTGDLVGVSFSVSAPPELFEAFFGVSLVQDARGVRCYITEEGGARESYELPLEALPPDLRKHVDAVTFGEPLAFGPGQV